ncbi:MAG: hypothetical protein K9J17_15280 [Flavobacteriales bacterium]|nr:hypothetical protein [Flavobacteriales bacterium]
MSKKAPADNEILDGVIIGFRNLINNRYQYDNINGKYEIPDSFDEERVARYRSFFLEQVYPHPEKRELLNEAFRSLDNYLTHPDRLARILFDSTAILLRHGRSLPRLLGAGIKAFKSFRIATEFEAKLVRKAKTSGKLPPYSSDDINSFITALRRADIDDFIRNTTALLELLYDRKLVREIIQILTELIARMKKSRAGYSEAEVGGLEIGLEMLKEGNMLFDQLSTADQKSIFNIIIGIEVDVLEELFAKEAESGKNSPKA